MLVVCSDTHSRESPRLEGRTETAVEEADLVVHAGDFTTGAVLEAFQARCDLRGVYGNNDRPAIRERLPHRHPAAVRPLLGVRGRPPGRYRLRDLRTRGGTGRRTRNWSGTAARQRASWSSRPARYSSGSRSNRGLSPDTPTPSPLTPVVSATDPRHPRRRRDERRRSVRRAVRNTDGQGTPGCRRWRWRAEAGDPGGPSRRWWNPRRSSTMDCPG
ncbi:hypothetical protein BRC63_10985 [Halobacteriales archaeon QH_10_70_21]|nr:MAG: hypothetical protein BRC63_10985 [Halobacteriales archaeon QH_10_70_21]